MDDTTTPAELPPDVAAVVADAEAVVAAVTELDPALGEAVSATIEAALALTIEAPAADASVTA